MFNQKTLISTAQIWIPLAMVYTAAIGFAYISSQQVYRMSLNDPQVQVTAEAVDRVKAGQDFTALVPTERVDLATSLSPFVIFYDDIGKAIIGSGLLNGSVPSPPSGVFDYTKQHGEDRVTWQPQKNVRIAAVIRQTTKGYVLAGRSMYEIENRITALTEMAGIAWTLGLALSLAATLGIVALRENKHG